ncbi:type IV secretory system conjugative DNA transfer family protein [Taylorella equigenitalis]|uniref:Type IV secretion (DNA transfer) protein n=1 Tax=Taylorella equigenitalis ATCC 35865 TaxID=743973 RepID=A0ABN4AX44_9BURK|nr:type IV secretory system conjugative DNA transfer family protein [Taylorella equigenitalis]AFN36209.1 Type IV secretion (DNA transfer) protein [Taylorella equigenitalis ATCC 35865]ASY39610.1 type VI secretion protein [Taylorella equigenitalis]VEG31986.1 Conjugal transfer protein traG [Taylorella equigenitalis ATCC 35865]
MKEKKKGLVVVLIFWLVITLLGLAFGGFIFALLSGVKVFPNPVILFKYMEFWELFYYKIGVGIAFVFSLFGLALGFIVVNKKPRRELHGSARFANSVEIKNFNLFDEKHKDPEILIGKFDNKFLKWSGKQFAFLAAPTRSGKGVGIVIPNCLNYRDSMVVFDPKLENFQITGGFREKVLGQKVYLFNPSTKDFRSHCWNPMSYISRDKYRMVGDALNMANILYSSTESEGGGGNSKFFAEMAQKLFTGLVLYMVERENLEKGTDNWDDSKVPSMSLLQSLTTQYPSEYSSFANWIKKCVAVDKNYSQACKENLMSYATTSDQTGASILSSLVAPLSVFSDPIVQRVTSSDDFDLREVRKQKMTIYIGIQPNDIAKFSRLINLFVSQLISLNTEELPEQNKSLKYQCLLLLDEFAALGKVDIIEKSVAYIAGYNLRLLLIFQNMSQLNRIYTKDGARSLSTNFECQIIYPPRDNDDAKEYSEIIGYETYKSESKSKNKGQIGSSSTSISDQKRAVMNPEELRQMDKSDCIISMTGIYPIHAKKIIYYKDPFFKKRLGFEPSPIPLIKEFKESDVNNSDKTDTGKSGGINIEHAKQQKEENLEYVSLLELMNDSDIDVKEVVEEIKDTFIEMLFPSLDEEEKEKIQKIIPRIQHACATSLKNTTVEEIISIKEEIKDSKNLSKRERKNDYDF